MCLVGNRFFFRHPLLALLNVQQAIPSHSSAHVQHWAPTLAAYECTFIAQKTDSHANKDALSRLPLTESISSTPVPAELILIMDMLKNCPNPTAQYNSSI